MLNSSNNISKSIKLNIIIKIENLNKFICKKKKELIHLHIKNIYFSKKIIKTNKKMIKNNIYLLINYLIFFIRLSEC